MITHLSTIAKLLANNIRVTIQTAQINFKCRAYQFNNLITNQ